MPSNHMDRSKQRGGMFRGGSGWGHGGGRGAGLMGSVPRHGSMAQSIPGLLGGAPRSDFHLHPRDRHPIQRGMVVNPWEGGLPPNMRGHPQHPQNPPGGMMPGSHHLTPHSLLGNPDVFGAPPPVGGGGGGGGGHVVGGGPGLMGGSPGNAAMMGINQLTQMNNRESKMALNILNSVLGPMPGPPQYGGPPPSKMRRLEQRIGVGGGGGSGRSMRGGITHHHQQQRHPQQLKGSNNLPQDLRRRLKDKRSGTASIRQTAPSTSASKAPLSSSSKSSSSTAEASSKSSDATTAETDKSSDSKEQPKQTIPTTVSSESVASASSEPAEEAPAKPPTEALIPVEAIQCHMCNLDKFSSRRAYLAHLSGGTHEEMAGAFHSKNSALLQLLRTEAKVAAQRQVIATRVAGEKVKLSQCFKCHCQVAGSLQKHIASVEHRLVNNYQILKCCNVCYSNRLEYEEHRLTLAHQLREYETKQKKEAEQKSEQTSEEEETETPEELEVSWASVAAKAVQQLTKESSTSLTLATIKPYTGQFAIGEDLLSCQGVIRCSACSETVAPAMLDLHCRSNAHYNKVLQAIKLKEDAAKAAAAEAATAKEAKDSAEKTSQQSNEDKDTKDNKHKSEKETPEGVQEDEEDNEDGDYAGQDDDALVEGDLMPLLEFEDGTEEEEEEEKQELSKTKIKKDDKNLNDQDLKCDDLDDDELQDDGDLHDEDLHDHDLIDQEYEEDEEEEVGMELDANEDLGKEVKTEVVKEVESPEREEQMQFEDEPVKEEEEEADIEEKTKRSVRRSSSSEAPTRTSTSPRRAQRTNKKRTIEDVEAQEEKVVEKEEEEIVAPAEVVVKTPRRGRGRGRGRVALKR